MNFFLLQKCIIIIILLNEFIAVCFGGTFSSFRKEFVTYKSSFMAIFAYAVFVDVAYFVFVYTGGFWTILLMKEAD